MKLNTHRFFSATIALLFASSSLVGCELSEGDQGNLSFVDETVGNVGLEAGVATGATIELRVVCFNCPSDEVESATSLTPQLVEVVAYEEDILTLRTLQAGEASVEVTTLDGTTDSITFEVEDVASSRVRLEPWGDTFPLPVELWESGFAMLIDSEIDVRAFAKGADGERLTGYGAVEFQATNGAEINVPAERARDIVSVLAPAQTGTFDLTTSSGESESIRVVTEGDVSTVELVVLAEEAPIVLMDGETLSLDTSSSLVSFHLAARTSDGTYVAGAGSDLGAMTLAPELDGILVDGAEVFLAADTDVEDVEEARQFFERGFFVQLEGGTGSGDATFTWRDHSVTVTIDVAQSSAIEE